MKLKLLFLFLGFFAVILAISPVTASEEGMNDSLAMFDQDTSPGKNAAKPESLEEVSDLPDDEPLKDFAQELEEKDAYIDEADDELEDGFAEVPEEEVDSTEVAELNETDDPENEDKELEENEEEVEDDAAIALDSEDNDDEILEDDENNLTDDSEYEESFEEEPANQDQLALAEESEEQI